MQDESFVALEEQGIDLKKWLCLFFRNWALFLFCIIIALAGALGFVMYSSPVYELSTNVLVNKENNPLDKAQLFASAFYKMKKVY